MCDVLSAARFAIAQGRRVSGLSSRRQWPPPGDIAPARALAPISFVSRPSQTTLMHFHSARPPNSSSRLIAPRIHNTGQSLASTMMTNKTLVGLTIVVAALIWSSSGKFPPVRPPRATNVF
jgi:hypothetical protein